MKSKQAARIAFVLSVAALIALSGCAGAPKHMNEVGQDKANYAPTADTSVIVFMRPSGMAFRVQSTVFDVSDENTPSKIIGIIAAKKRVAYVVKPGTHRFMVLGESADFMDAELEAGKTYYAFVAPRMGAWKARFSLDPVNKDELKSDGDFKGCDASCGWLEMSSETDAWAEKHKIEIEAKRTENLAIWIKKPDDQRPKLKIGDSR